MEMLQCCVSSCWSDDGDDGGGGVVGCLEEPGEGGQGQDGGQQEKANKQEVMEE